MNEKIAKEILDVIVGRVFGYQNPYSLEQAMTQFAFDVRLPQEVRRGDAEGATWAAAMRQGKHVPFDVIQAQGFSPKTRTDDSLESLEKIIGAWGAEHRIATERMINSDAVAESDGVYNSRNVYRSIDVRKSHDILFSDGVDSCEYVVAGQTSKACATSIRVEDSKRVKDSFSVHWSSDVESSMFIQDSFQLKNCLFCSQLSNAEFHVANQPVSPEEFYKIKDQVIRWVFGVS